MENLDFETYRLQNQLKGRTSKKARTEHDRSLYVAWFNLYKKPQEALLDQAKNIINR